MAGQFETLDLGAVDRDLRIEVGAGTGHMEFDEARGKYALKPSTEIRIQPPPTETEHAALVGSFGIESEVGRSLVSGMPTGRGLKLTVNGAPSEKHLALSEDLARELITLKSLRAARIVETVDGKDQEHLVLYQETGNTAIDADAFEIDSVDPAWQKALGAARQHIAELETGGRIL